MKRSIVAVMSFAALVTAACGTSVASLSASSVSAPSPSPSQAPVASPDASQAPAPSSNAADVSRYFSIEEIGLGPHGYVTLLNYTSVSASLDTLYLCQASGCADLPDVVVGPGEIARIAVGDGAGLEKVAMMGAGLDLPPLDGEIAVYASKDVRNSNDVRAYLEWGSTPHELTTVAIEAGLWLEGSYAPSGPNATRLWKTDGNLWVWDPGVG
jgi:hypothetical protein